MSVAILGAGAFGTALAIALSEGGLDVTLYGRDADAMRTLARTRKSPHLPDVAVPDGVAATSDPADLGPADIVLLCVPAQRLSAALDDHAGTLAGKPLVACCKGIDIATLRGPTASIAAAVPSATPAILTGPSFATDIARGLPTALTLACRDDSTGVRLQSALSTDTLRLYRTTDVTGAELGGALKNVVAIACGAAIGAGYGDSARAAVMTRGFAEMRRLADALGADPETLTGLSGLGDLALTCTSDQSRNYRYGRSIGAGSAFDGAITVEGAATAKSVVALARSHDLDLPVATAVAALVSGRITVETALQTLISRPLKEET